MYMLCEKLHTLPNGGGLMDQTPTNVARMQIFNMAREERERAKQEQEEWKAKQSGRQP